MKEVIKITFTGFVVSISSTTIALVILVLISHFYPSIITSMSSNVGKTDNFSLIELSIILPIAAILEETIFRLLPMVIVIYIAPRYLNTKSGILSVAVISSVLFGYLHGNIVNISIQGIAGFIFFMVWLAVYDIKRSIIISTLASSMTHLCDNVFLTCMAALAKSLKRLIYYYM